MAFRKLAVRSKAISFGFVTALTQAASASTPSYAPPELGWRSDSQQHQAEGEARSSRRAPRFKNYLQEWLELDEGHLVTLAMLGNFGPPPLLPLRRSDSRL